MSSRAPDEKDASNAKSVYEKELQGKLNMLRQFSYLK